MNAFDRLARIDTCWRSAWAESSHQAPSLQLNQWLLPSGTENDHRYGGTASGDRPKKRWVARLGGLVGEGDTPEEAAESLERLVFDGILNSLDERIAKSDSRTAELRELKKTVTRAMGRPTMNIPTDEAIWKLTSKGNAMSQLLKDRCSFAPEDFAKRYRWLLRTSLAELGDGPDEEHAS